MRIKDPVFYFIIFLNAVLLFLFFAGEQLQLSPWLQVYGRMHPLILHFPIVLVVISIVASIITSRKKSGQGKGWADWLWLATTSVAILTALSGLFLANEEGYDATSYALHKNSGVILAQACVLWLFFQRKIYASAGLLTAYSVFTIFALLVTGHQGANLTHGEGFLTMPLQQITPKPAVTADQAIVFQDIVQPIFEQKCYSCHNSKKAKGELVLETKELILKGGKTGLLWEPGAMETGLLMQRLHLPEDDKKHMPPKGKPQLTLDELALLYQWVKTGAVFETKLTSLKETDSLRIAAAPFVKAGGNDFEALKSFDEKKVAALNDGYLLVEPIALNSNALKAAFFGITGYKPERIAQLEPLKNNLVALNLAKMPVEDKELEVVGNLTELRKLNLSFTQITTGGLTKLNTLKKLEELILSGNKLTAEGLGFVNNLPALKHIYLWNTGISEADIVALEKKHSGISFINGFYGDTVFTKLSVPVIKNEEDIFSDKMLLTLKHGIGGTEIRYTLDGKEPDSIRSALYKNPIEIDSPITIKTKAFLKGWQSSDVAERSFFKTGIKPDTAWLVKPGDEGYNALGITTLLDNQKGGNDIKNKMWLGFRNHPADVYLEFKQPIKLSSLIIGSINDIGGYVMPPQKIQVYGKLNGAYKLLQTMVPPQPTAYDRIRPTAYHISWSPQQVSGVRLVVQPVSQLPSWHNGKGDKGWVFIDEVFLY